MNKTTIILDDHEARIEASFRHLIVPLLEHSVYRFHVGGPLGYQHKNEVAKHYRIADDGRVLVSAGFMTRVRQHLERHGYAVTVGGQTNGLDFFDLHLRMLEDPELTAESVSFLESIAINRFRGQIHLPRSSDIGRHIALFAQFTGNLNIYVVARNKNRVRQLVAEISKHTNRTVTSDSRAVWHSNPRIFVGTVKLFQHSMSDGFHVAIFTDAESVLACRLAHDAEVPDDNSCPFRSDAQGHNEYKQFRINEVWADRIWYAILEFPTALSEFERFLVEEICRPVIYAPMDDTPAESVDVEFVPVDRTGCTKIKSALQRKRDLYWHSPAWNELVSSVATTRTGKRQRRTVCILVESSEHGRELLKQLPRWGLLTTNTPTTCVPVVAHRQIATLAYAERWGIGTDVVIRADGGSGWPLSPRFVRLVHRDDNTVLLIDFADGGDRLARRDTESRQVAYQRRGWNIAALSSK